MRWKLLALLTCLLIGIILVAWILGRPHIPRGAKKALDLFEQGPYSLLSAQQVQGSEDWCVEIEINYYLDIYCGPSAADNVNCPPSRYPGTTYHYLLVKRGDHWRVFERSSCPVK